jgi:hypothetical protein
VDERQGSRHPGFKVVGGGLIDLFEDVFRDDPADVALYAAHIPEEDPEANERFRAKTPQARYKKCRTWQMSDHAPLWIEVQTDFADSGGHC